MDTVNNEMMCDRCANRLGGLVPCRSSDKLRKALAEAKEKEIVLVMPFGRWGGIGVSVEAWCDYYRKEAPQ